MEGKEILRKLEKNLSYYIIDLNDYDLKEKIGEGSSGIVYLAYSKRTRYNVAIKEMKIKNYDDEETLKAYCHEIQMLSLWKNPFLLRLIGFTVYYPYCIVTEYIPNGSIWNVLHNQDNKMFLTGDQKNKIAIGIASGMLELHKHNVVHRDLKSLNILLDENYLPIICDFGSAKLMDDDEDFNIKTGQLGTPAWMAPELFKCALYSKKIDVYSYAIILWELETESIPYKGMNFDDIVSYVVKNHGRPPFPSTILENLKRLISICWDEKPEERLSFKKILSLFLSKKVHFKDAKIESILLLKKTLLDFNECNERGQGKYKNILSIFKEHDRTNIINFTKNLDCNNCNDFFEAVTIMINNFKIDIINIALYELLKLILKDDKFLLLYVQSKEYMKLPFYKPELREISLSIMIPILEKHLDQIPTNFYERFYKLLSSCTTKVTRLFCIIFKNSKNELDKQEIANGIFNNMDVYLDYEPQLFILILSQMILYISNFYEIFQKQLNISIQLLVNSSLNEIDEKLYHIILNIIKKNNDNIEIDKKILIKDMVKDNKKALVLQYIAMKGIKNIDIELIGMILNEVERTKFAEESFFKICESSFFDERYIAYFNQMFKNEKMSSLFKLKTLILLMLNESFREALGEIKNIYKFLNSQIIEYTQNIKVIWRVLMNINLNKEYLLKINLIKTFLDIINDSCNIKYIKLGCILIEKIGEHFWLPEFLSIFQTIYDKIDEDESNIKLCYLEYLLTISRYKESIPHLLNSDILNKIDVENLSNKKLEIYNNIKLNVNTLQ